MSDEELLALLENRTPEELTPAEIELVRSRLKESPRLREALATQLQLDAGLHETLGPIHVPAGVLADRAASQWRSKFGTLAILLLLLLAAGGFAVYSASRHEAPVVAGQPEQAVDDTSEAETPQVAASPTNPQPTPPNDESPKSRGPSDPPAVTPVEPTPVEPTPVEPAPNAAPPSQKPDEVVDSPQVASNPPPWHAALDLAGEPPDFREVALGAAVAGTSLTSQEELARWFGRVPRSSFRLGQTETRDGRAGTIEGLGRLLSPWPDDSALRLQLENHNRLKIHLFHKQQGVSLVYYEDAGYSWAAYATTRKEDEPTPTTWHLTSTDDERGKRTQLRFGGPIELRYCDGEVVLSRGDIVLVSASLPGPPTDVFVDGRATVLRLDLVRSRGVPALPEHRTVVYDSDRPAELKWSSQDPEVAEPEMLTSGAVRLAANNAQQRVESHTPLPATGLSEVIVQLADVTPGTGVFLGRTEGKPHEVVRFYRDRRSGQLAARLHGWDDEWEADVDSPAEKVAPLVQPQLWVKMLLGCGNFQWWLSSDGRHWAQPQGPHEPATPEVTSIGLQVVARRPDTHITLQRIVLRRLDGLSSLAESSLVVQAPPILTASSPGTWLLEVLRKKPPDVATDEWLRACAVRALAGGAHRDVAYAILEGLLNDAARRGLPVDAQLAALDDALLMCSDLRDEQRMRRGVFTRYVDLGRRASDEHGVGAWSSLRLNYLSAPVHRRHQHPVNLDPLFRDELIQAVHSRSPDGVLDLVHALRLFQFHREQPLVEWAASVARRAAPRQPAGEIPRIKDSWREPLIEELSKEAYNAMTELQAVLESQAWEDAARLVTTIDGESASGVAPYVNDKALLASLPVAIQLALADYPQLRESLGDRFAPLAELRLAQAIAAADAAAIELTSIQFPGTPAAAEAHQWLGDRALASGWFQRAISEYENARSIEPSRSAELQPRLRLAAAMLGRDAAPPVTGPVRFGELTLSAAEFESLVSEMRGRPQQGELSAVAAQPLAVPRSSGFETHVRSRLDGPAGEKPAEEVGRRTNQYRVPWVDRQIATVVEGSTLYVANRFQVAAYNLDNGQRLWQSEQPPGNMQRAQDWAMIPMRPLVTADRIYVRLLYTSNPLLVCLEKSSGKLLWIAETPEREHLVSDPVIVQGQLVALAIALQSDQQGILRWTSFDPHSGDLLRQRDLVRLRNTWGARSCCQVTLVDDGLITALGGVTLAVDTTGGVRWIRSHITLPADEDPRWVLQKYEAPVVQNKHVFTAQPGMRTVECLATDTGSRLWSTVLPDVVSIVGLAGPTLVVRTETGVRGLDAAAGRPLWRCAADELYGDPLLDDERLLIAERERHPTENGRWQTRLTWLDPHRGLPLATTVPPKLDDSDPRLGQFVPHKDRLFVFFGRGQHDPHRDLVELIPKGDAIAVRSPTVMDAWRLHVPEAIARPAEEILDSWQLLSGQAGDRTGRIEDWQGERRVLGVRSTRAAPLVLAREVTLPQQGRPRLRLRVGRDGGQHWKLDVCHGDALLQAEEIKDETHPDRWQTLDIDLAPVAGQPGWLTVRAQATNGDHVLYIHSAEISF